MIDLGDSVAIVGAGPVGLVSALLLAQQGYDVQLFEARPDPRVVAAPRGRSISLTLTSRGWTALRKANVEPRIRKISIPLRGRLIHLETGELRFQEYGSRGEAIDSLSRRALTASLLEAVAGVKGIQLRFGWKCSAVLPEQQLLTFYDPEGREVAFQAAKVLAADGATSAIRTSLLGQQRLSLNQSYSRFLYKELSVDFREDGSWPLDPNQLHLWPRGECMLAAFANPAQGFTCTLLLPLEGEASFNALARPEDLKAFFRTNFADLLELMPCLVTDFYMGVPAHLVSLRCYPWVFEGLTLIGDSAHAIFPFLGQGLNAGLEDATVLLDCLDRTAHDWQQGLLAYQQLRKPNCDAVTDIAASHYWELAQDARDPSFVLRKHIEVRLGEIFPEQLPSAYHIVSFSDRPYLDAKRAASLQSRVIEQLLLQPGIQQLLTPDEATTERLRAIVQALLPILEPNASAARKHD